MRQLAASAQIIVVARAARCDDRIGDRRDVSNETFKSVAGETSDSRRGDASTIGTIGTEFTHITLGSATAALPRAQAADSK